MRLLFKIIFIIMGLSLSCCKTDLTKRRASEVSFVSRDIIETISKDFINDNFKDSNVILVEIEREFERGNLLLKISEDNFVQSFSVQPDSMDFFINSYIETNNKLFLFRSDKNVKKPSQVYSKIQSYGVVLDSCFIKYKYLDPNPNKFSDCFYSKKRVTLFDTSKSVYLLAKQNERNGRYEVFKTVDGNVGSVPN